jgi:hypothetical protein
LVLSQTAAQKLAGVGLVKSLKRTHKAFLTIVLLFATYRN